MAPFVEAYQAMRGASFLVAVIFTAEIGDVRRFDTPRQLMSFLGLVPAESSTGETIRRKGSPWPATGARGGRSSRRPDIPRSGENQRDLESPVGRLLNLVRDIAWKAQARLCARYRRLSATGKTLPVVVAAIRSAMKVARSRTGASTFISGLSV